MVSDDEVFLFLVSFLLIFLFKNTIRLNNYFFIYLIYIILCFTKIE